MDSATTPDRRTWKRELAPYLERDPRRAAGQVASVVAPYLAVWIAVAILRPGPLVAIALGLVATVFLVRAYSLFHDLTHGSLFRSRRANHVCGYGLGFLLFTPFRWWQRQHAVHHAHTGDLEHRGVGEIHTMTLAEYRAASPARRLAYRLYRNPVLLLLIGPALVFAVERRFPQRGMSKKILFSVVLTNVALAGWVLGWASLVGWGTYALVQGTTLIAGGAVAAWMLYVQHQYEDTYYAAPETWRFELAALQGSSYLKLPRVLAWAVGNANFHHVHHLSAKIPNFRLAEAHAGHAMFAATPVITLRGSLATFRLKLWDEEAATLVPFPSLRARAGRPVDAAVPAGSRS